MEFSLPRTPFDATVAVWPVVPQIEHAVGNHFEFSFRSLYCCLMCGQARFRFVSFF